MPKPFRHVAAYRTGSGGIVERIGVFTRLSGELGRAVFDGIVADRENIEREVGPFTDFGWDATRDEGTVAIAHWPAEGESDQTQLEWVLSAADRFVSMLCPRLAVVGG